MIPFKRLELARRQEVFDWFHQAGRLGCEYSFVNLYLWGRQHAAFVEGYLVVFSHFYGHSMYLFPSGFKSNINKAGIGSLNRYPNSWVAPVFGSTWST